MSRHAIHTATARAKLTARREPYFGPSIKPGLFVGFRKLGPVGDGAGTWIAKYRDDEGQRRYESLGKVDHIDYGAACEKALAWNKDIDDGIADSEIKTVAELCRERVKNRRQVKGETNAAYNAGMYRNHVYDADIGGIKLAKLQAKHIRAWRDALVDKRTGKPLGGDAKDRVRAALNAALNFGVAEHHINANRASEWKHIEDVGEGRRRELYLDLAQRRALVDAAPEFARPFLRGLCVLPLRPGALAQCTVKSLNVMHKGKETLYIAKEADKANGGRHIPLPADTLAFFREQAKDKLPSAPLIAYRDGGHWTNDTWKQAIRKARKGAELDITTCAYTLRHSVITDLINGGMDTLTVAYIAGTSAKEIEKHYYQLIHDLARNKLANVQLAV